jgi:hypothetical protein
MLSQLEKRHIPSLEQWSTQPFANEREMIDAMLDAEYKDARNPVYRIALQAKLSLPFTDELSKRHEDSTRRVALDKAAADRCLPKELFGPAPTGNRYL